MAAPAPNPPGTGTAGLYTTRAGRVIQRPQRLGDYQYPAHTGLYEGMTDFQLRELLKLRENTRGYSRLKKHDLILLAITTEPAAHAAYARMDMRQLRDELDERWRDRPARMPRAAAIRRLQDELHYWRLSVRQMAAMRRAQGIPGQHDRMGQRLWLRQWIRVNEPGKCRP